MIRMEGMMCMEGRCAWRDDALWEDDAQWGMVHVVHFASLIYSGVLT